MTAHTPLGQSTRDRPKWQRPDYPVPWGRRATEHIQILNDGLKSQQGRAFAHERATPDGRERPVVVILNDAAGLDMESYLMNKPPTTDQDYLTTWTDDPAEWKNASPINFINSGTPKIKMYTGKKTYKSIISSNNNFMEELQSYQPQASIQLLDKNHVPMVTQLFWPWNSRFDEMEKFVRQQ